MAELLERGFVIAIREDRMAPHEGRYRVNVNRHIPYFPGQNELHRAAHASVGINSLAELGVVEMLISELKEQVRLYDPRGW